MEKDKQVFIVRKFDAETKKRIKMIAVEKDLTMAEAIKYIVNEFYKNRS